MNDYMVILQDDAEALARTVKDALADGWQVQGGVSVLRYTYLDERKGYEVTEWLFAQAVVRQ